MAEQEKDVNTEQSVENETENSAPAENPAQNTDNKSKNQTTANQQNVFAPEKKTPTWLENIGNFFKMLFITPIALIHRILQRIALGKEGAAKADQEAEWGAKKQSEKAAMEGRAKERTEKIQQIIRDSDSKEFGNLAITAAEIYVSKNGQENAPLTFAIRCANGTVYSVSMDEADQLYADKTVPPEITQQMRKLLNDTREYRIESNTGEKSPETGEKEAEGKEPSSPEKANSESRTRLDVVQNENDFSCEFKGHTVSFDKASGKLSVDGVSYDAKWNQAACAVQVNGLSLAGPLEMAMISKVLAKAFEQENNAVPTDPSAKVAEQLAASSKSSSPVAFFTPSVYGVVQQGKTNTFIHMGNILETDGKFELTNLVKTEKGCDGFKIRPEFRGDIENITPAILTAYINQSHPLIIDGFEGNRCFYEPLVNPETGKCSEVAGVGIKDGMGAIAFSRKEFASTEILVRSAQQAKQPLGNDDIKAALDKFASYAFEKTGAKAAACVGDTCLFFDKDGTGLTGHPETKSECAQVIAFRADMPDAICCVSLRDNTTEAAQEAFETVYGNVREAFAERAEVPVNDEAGNDAPLVDDEINTEESL